MDEESESREALEQQMESIRLYNEKDISQRTSLLDELGSVFYFIFI